MDVIEEVAKRAETTCRFCGKPLRMLGFDYRGKHFSVPCWGSCGCKASADHYGHGMPGKSIEQRLTWAGVPKRYLDVPEPCKDMAHRLMLRVDAGRGIFLAGCVGCGKTSVASWMARELLISGKTVRFDTSMGLLNAIMASFDGNGTDPYSVAVNADVLILDDLGKEVPKDWALSMLSDILNARYNALEPTIITTNYSSGQLAEVMAKRAEPVTSQAIISRIKADCDPMTMAPVDWRNRLPTK